MDDKVEHRKADMERISQKPFCHGLSIVHLWLSYFMIKLPNSVQHHTNGPRYESGTISCMYSLKSVLKEMQKCVHLSL